MISITVPLPSPAVSANARGSWHARHKARQTQRAIAMVAAREAASKATGLPIRRFEASYQFRFATRRRRDLDNLVYSMKATLDGLQDAGVIEDDCGLVALSVNATIVSTKDEAGVLVTIKDAGNGEEPA